MKKSIITSLLSLFLITCFSVAQDEADATYDGDNFSLEGALELFKSSSSLEEFEEKLNTEDSKVNNLDLDQNGETDYIRVVDNMDGDVHAIVLQVPLSNSESQDIAVIEIEKDGPESALLQIIGDEDVYGDQVIVEPFDVESTPNGRGPDGNLIYTKIVVNVWFWPSVRYVYQPGYRIYISPWYWGYYPRWYRPWRPLRYSVFRPYKVRYHTHYHVVNTHRVVKARKIYTPKRKTTTTVASRTKVTRTKVGVKNVNGNKVVSKKTSTKTVKTNAVGQKAVKSETSAKGAVKKADGTKAAGKKTTKKKGVKTDNGKAGIKKSKTTKAKKTKSGKASVKKKTTTKKKGKRN